MKSPADAYPAAWAITRKYETELESTKIEIRKLIRKNQASIDQIPLYLVLCDREDAHEEALRVLNNSQSYFDESDARLSWEYWQTKLGDFKKESLDFSTLVNKEVPNPEELNIAFDSAKSPDDRSYIYKAFDQGYENTSNPTFLINGFVSRAKEKEWDNLEERIFTFVNKIHTSMALRMVLQAAWEASKPDLVLNLIEEYPLLAGNDPVPPDILKWKLNCFLSLGKRKNAIPIVEQLYEDEEQVGHLLTIAKLHQSLGNPLRAASIAIKALDHEKLDPSIALEFAGAFTDDDSNLAGKFFDRIDSEALPSEAIPVAVGIGFRLKRDS